MFYYINNIKEKEKELEWKKEALIFSKNLIDWTLIKSLTIPEYITIPNEIVENKSI